MSLVSLILALVVIGVVLYLIGLLPIDETIKRIIYVIVILVVVLWVIQALFGVGLPGLHVPVR